MKYIYKLLTAFIAVTLFLNVPTAFASNEPSVQSRTRLDTSSGVFSGLYADYTFSMPKDTGTRQLLVDRVILADASMALEKLDFFVQPVTTGTKPALLLSIYVFSTKQWNTAYRLKLITQSRDYVFAAYFEEQNPFTQTPDRSVFTYYRQIMGTTSALKQLLLLPLSQMGRYELTLFLNGDKLSEPVIERGGTYYVPLRQLAEGMGYSVTWSAQRRSVTLLKGLFKHQFVIPGTVYFGSGYTVRLLDGRCYATTSYFTRVLFKNVEIDEYGNVYVFSK